MHKVKGIILASASPRRREILEKTGLKFRVFAGNYEEDMSIPLPPHKLARFLSEQKAKAVSERFRNAIIIAADTFIVFRGSILGKPHTEEEARKMLKTLNGKAHSVITGFTILDSETGKSLSVSASTKVYFRKLKASEICSYVASGEPLDKAGAYGIQGLGAVMIKKIEGDFFNVMGLPLSALTVALRKFGIHIL